MQIREQTPKISFITAVYNAKFFLNETLASIVNQDYPNKEIIVIDGGSNDGTKDVIINFDEHIDFWISELDKGIYDAMNKGLQKATGDFVTFINAGDTYCTNSVVSELFSEYNQQDVVYGDINVITVDGTRKRYQKARPFTEEKLLQHGTGVLCHQAIFVLREIAPLYNLRWKIKGELCWYFDIIKSQPTISYLHIPIAVVDYRLSGYGYNHFWQNQLEWLRLVKSKYGIISLIRYNYAKKLWKKMQYRYPNLLPSKKRK